MFGVSNTQSTHSSALMSCATAHALLHILHPRPLGLSCVRGNPEVCLVPRLGRCTRRPSAIIQALEDEKAEPETWSFVSRMRISFKVLNIPVLQAGKTLWSRPIATTQEVATEHRPALAVSGHCASALPAQHAADVIIFGGYTEDTHKRREVCNRAWTFSEKDDQWSEARLVAQTAVVGNHLWLVGGWDPGHKQDGGNILNDVWSLDLEGYRWTQHTPQDEALPAISRFQAAAVGDAIYIHTHRSIDNILRLDCADPAAPRLSKVPVSGPGGTPMSRGLHTLTAVGDALYLFAGAPQSGPMLGDLWRFDIASASWHELDPDGQVPHVRCSQAAAALGSKIVSLGGSYYKEEGGLQPLADVFAYDTEQNVWEYPEAAGKELFRPRNAHTLTAISDTLAVAFGGWHPFVQTYDDTFVLGME